MHGYQRFSLLILLFLLTTVGVALTPLTQGTPATRPDQATGFHEYVLPRLIALNESVGKVESMVAERSRNVLALQAHADKIEALTEQIDDYLASESYHGEYGEIVGQYRLGRDIVLSAITEARESLRSFDFSSIPALTTRFADGSDRLEDALALLQGMEQSRSSYTVSQIADMRSS